MLSAHIKASIKHLAKRVGLLNVANRLEYLYGNRITARAMTFYAQFIAAGELCFDVGSHYGMKTELFRRLGAKTIAIEPQPACCASLRRKFSRADSSITVVEAGVGANPGSGALYISELNPQNSTLFDPDQTLADSKDVVRSHPIKIVTLDSLIAEFGCPVFCKIDAEGFELSILQGLTHSIPALSLEFHCFDLATSHACLDRLLLLGNYTFNYCIGGSLIFQASHLLDRSTLFTHLSALPQQTSGDIYAVQVRSSPEAKSARKAAPTPR